MKGRGWQITGYLSLFVLAILLVVGFTSYEGSAEGSIAAPTPSLPTVSMSCQQAMDAIQTATDEYHHDKRRWPTTNCRPGDIVWVELVPDYMEAVPSNDSKCDFRVNSNPEGDICIAHRC